MHGAITEQNCLVATQVLQLELQELQKFYKKLLGKNFSGDVAQAWQKCYTKWFSINVNADVAQYRLIPTQVAM